MGFYYSTHGRGGAVGRWRRSTMRVGSIEFGIVRPFEFRFYKETCPMGKCLLITIGPFYLDTLRGHCL